MTTHEAVVAGGGPTGLMLAAELALGGVDVVVVERRPSQELAGARAGGLQARTIEVLDQRGVAARFLAAGEKLQVAGFGMTRLDIADFPTRHPYGLALPQAPIERLLAAWVRELGVSIAYGTQVEAFEQDEDGVDVALSEGRSLRARYLLGCDGGRSAIRKRAGIGFEGWDPSVSYLIAEASFAEEPPWGMRPGDRGVNGIAKLDDGKRARIVLSEPEVRQGDAPSFDELRDEVRALYGHDFGLRDVTWLSRFTDAARQAVAYRAGRVLLAGDAAHVHSPTGGQGLNLGVQDAVNLGWKLASVLRGRAPDTLLDTYHAERHPVAARVLETTLAQTALARGDARTTALRAHVAEMLAMEEPRKRYAGLMSGLGLRYDLGDGHPLVGRRMPDLDLATSEGPRRVYEWLHAARPLLLRFDGPALRASEPWADRVIEQAARYEGVWELPVIGAVAPPSAVLVRPDGYVAWVSQGGEDGLREALDRWVGPAAAA